MFLTTTWIKQKLAYDFWYMGFRVTSNDWEVFECRSERPRKYIKTDSKENAMKLIKEWRRTCSW